MSQTRSDIRTFLTNLPNEALREFELEITAFAVANNNNTYRVHLQSLIEDDSSEDVRYRAFFCLHTMYRRAKDFRLLAELMANAKSSFKNHSSFSHLYILSCLESDSLYDYEEVLKLAEENSKKFPDNSGYMHMFADLVVTIYEKGGVTNAQEYLSQWYDSALDAANQAINLDEEYAKFYCTKGRILAMKHHYDQAIRNINQAISLEPSHRTDYVMRIGSYQYHKTCVMMDHKLHLFKEQYGFLPDTLSSPKSDSSYLSSHPHLTAYPGDAPYVFISYAHVDYQKVYSVLDQLQNHNIRFWFDRGIPTSRDYYEVIANRISACSIALFMVSHRSVLQDFVRKEFHHTINNGKQYILYYIEETELSAGMQLQLEGHHAILGYAMEENTNLSKILEVLPPETRGETS